MKKYLSGILAVLLAVAFSSFTAYRLNPVEYHYTSSSFLKEDVENPANWYRYGFPTPGDCGGFIEEVTCTIELPSDEYETMSGTLDPSKIQIVSDFLTGDDEEEDPVFVTAIFDITGSPTLIENATTVKGALP